MEKQTRLIILIFCVACFFIVAPILVAYSMGYRFDFDKENIVATGGIYVRTFPTAGQITIDSGVSEKPGLFSNYVFVQSLLPKSHTVSIKKDGYFDYSKILPVKENQVTKLENVTLIKKTIIYNNLADKVDYFSIANNNQNIITASTGTKSINFSYFATNSQVQPKVFSVAQVGTISNIKWTDDSSKALINIKSSSNNLYYIFDSSLQKPTATRLSYLDKNAQQISFDPQDSKIIFYIKNKTLYSAKGNSSLPIINNIISYKISGADIIWLSTKGIISASDFTGKLVNKITLSNFPVSAQKTYEILFISGTTFLKEDNALFKLNQNTQTLENFSVPATNYKILTSPDGKNFVYWSDKDIYLYSSGDSPEQTTKTFTKIFSGSQITNCQWLNNEYIILTSGDKIIISEIDYRGNINSVTLAQKADQTYFNPQDGKLYILTQNALLASEKLVP